MSKPYSDDQLFAVCVVNEGHTFDSTCIWRVEMGLQVIADGRARNITDAIQRAGRALTEYGIDFGKDRNKFP